MLPGLAGVPFDIVHQIAGVLDVRSHDSLAKTCKSLYQHLQDENTAKKAIQVICFIAVHWRQLTALGDDSALPLGTDRPINVQCQLQTDA